MVAIVTVKLLIASYWHGHMHKVVSSCESVAYVVMGYTV